MRKDAAAGIDKVTKNTGKPSRLIVKRTHEEPCALIAHARFWEGLGPTDSLGDSIS